MRKFVIAPVAVALCVAGCSAQAGASAEKVRLGIGIDTAYAPVYLAEKDGLFDEAGAGVDVVQFAQGSQALDAQNAGQVNMSIAGDSAAVAKAATGQSQIVAYYMKDNGYTKLVVRDGIKAATDIKKMGVVKGSVGELCTTQFLDSKKIAPSSVEMISAGPPELPALLQRGDVDGFIFPEPWPSMAVSQGAHILEVGKDFGCSADLVVLANKDWLSKNKAAAETVLSALSAAVAKVGSDPAAAAAATNGKAKIPVDQVEAGLKQLNFGVRPIDEADTVRFTEIGAWLVDAGVLKQAPDIAAEVATGVSIK